MSFRISEDKSYEQQSFQWDKIVHSLELEIDDLPEEDRRYFGGIVKFLLNKETRLSNIPSRLIYYYMQSKNHLLLLTRYPMYVTPEYLRSIFAEHLGDLSILLAEDALAWKYGPMGFQESHVKQEITQKPEVIMREG